MHFAEANGPLQETAKSTQGKLVGSPSWPYGKPQAWGAGNVIYNRRLVLL